MFKVEIVRRLIMLLLSACILLSCNPHHEFARANRIEAGYMTQYINDSLKLSILYNGDYTFGEKKARISRLLKKNINYKLIKQEGKLLFSAQSTVTPRFRSVGFVQHKNKSEKSYLIDGYVKFGNSIYVKPTVDSTAIYYIIKTKYKDLLLYNTFVKTENDGESREILIRSMLAEFAAIYKNVRFNAFGSNILIKDPFHTADSAYIGTDGIGNYLKPLRLLLDIETRYDTVAAEYRNLYLYSMLTCLSFVDDKQGYAYFNRKLKGDRDQETIDITDYKFVGGRSQLLNLCKNEQVIMFNEAHTVPAHRRVVADLLPELHKAGFRYLALEALGEDGLDVTKRGYPVMSTGFYTREPQMANLIRTASRLGFTIVDYEDDMEKGEGQREFNQAMNLQKKILTKDPTAKLIVLAGHDHINELRDGRLWMAAEFKRLTKIDPLTINQTDFEDSGDVNSPDTLSIVKSKIAPNKNDLYVINKSGSTSDVSLGETKPRVKVDLIYPTVISTDYVVQIYLKKEFDIDSDAVPCYVKKVSDAQSVSVLLPEDTYVIVFVTDKVQPLRKRLIVSKGQVRID